MNYNTSRGSSQSFDVDFDIRSYIDKLTPAKKSGKYICPSCGGHNLSINLKNGKYNCWNCGETQNIASILTKYEREHKQFQFDLDCKLKQNVKNKKRRELEEEYADDFSKDDIDKVMAVQKGMEEAVNAFQPGERLRLAIEGYLLEQDPLAKIAMKPAIMCKFSLGRAEFDAAVIEVYSSCSGSNLEIYESREFLTTEFRSQGFLVEGVPFNGTTVLGGEYGSGKSTLAYWLAKSVLTGNKFLADSPSQTGNVLIVNSDEGRADSQDRMIDMDFPEDGWRYLARFKIEQHWHDLEQLVAKDRPKLVLVDSFCGIHGRSFDENSSLSGLTIERFNNLAETYNCAVVVLHHTNKQGRLRGSSRILDIAHSVLLVDKRPVSRILRSEKVRGVEPFEYEFGLTDEGEIKVLKNNSKSKVPETIYGRVLKLLEDNYPAHLEVSEICSALSLSKNQAWEALKKLKSSGKAKQFASKRDKRAKVWTVCVAPSNLPPSPPIHVIVDPGNLPETTTGNELQPSRECQGSVKPELATLINSEETLVNSEETLVNSEETLVKFSDLNPNAEADHGEKPRVTLENQRGEGGENTTDNSVLQHYSIDDLKILWVIYDNEKWDVETIEDEFLTIKQYGKIDPVRCHVRYIDCEHIEFEK